MVFVRRIGGGRGTGVWALRLARRAGRRHVATMKLHAKTTGLSACPHDCPSTCSLEVEVLDANRIGRVRGAKDQTYTKGVIDRKSTRLNSSH